MHSSFVSIKERRLLNSFGDSGLQFLDSVKLNLNNKLILVFSETFI